MKGELNKEGKKDRKTESNKQMLTRKETSA
jgi:hypothetical protein